MNIRFNFKGGLSHVISVESLGGHDDFLSLIQKGYENDSTIQFAGSDIPVKKYSDIENIEISWG